jgi:hypothetical protein
VRVIDAEIVSKGGESLLVEITDCGQLAVFDQLVGLGVPPGARAAAQKYGFHISCLLVSFWRRGFERIFG